MPNVELDKIINAPDSATFAQAFFYRVDGDDLVLTVAQKRREPLYLPDEQLIEDEEFLSCKESFYYKSDAFDCSKSGIFFTAGAINRYLALNEGDDGLGFEYTENDFYKSPDADFYSVIQKKVPIKDFAKKAYEKKTARPYNTMNLSLVESLYRDLYFTKGVSMAGCSISGSNEESLTWAKKVLLDDSLVEQVESFIDNNNKELEKMTEFLNKQEKADVVFYTTDHIKSDMLIPVLNLPAMRDYRKVYESEPCWGSVYDAEKQLLYATLEGRIYDNGVDTPLRISPEMLSLELSGYITLPRIYPFEFLLSDKGAPSREAILKNLPDAQKVFDDLVDKAVSEFTSLELRTDSDKPHGAYFIVGGEERGFIPMQEIINNNNVLHLCPVSPATQNNNYYECCTEYVCENGRYSIKYGSMNPEASFVDYEEDKITRYPYIRTELYITADKIEQVVRIEGKYNESVSTLDMDKGKVSPIDSSNRGFKDYSYFCGINRARNYAEPLFSHKSVEDAVRAAALFRWCNLVRERLAGLS